MRSTASSRPRPVTLPSGGTARRASAAPAAWRSTASRVPAFAPRPREKDGTHRMQQIDIDRVQEFHKCIECFLCQTVCHVIRDHDENKEEFAGPRMFIKYAELEMHPLDTNDRRDLL